MGEILDKKEKRNIILPIVCLFLSICLWVYVTNTEDRIRTADISKVPVQLINTESLANSKLALVPNQDFYVNLKIEGSTADINKVKKSDFKIQVDLSEYIWKKGENKVPVTIVDYPVKVSIKNTSALMLSFKAEDLVEKSMKVTSNITINTRDKYYASEPIINPREVKVRGAKSSVDKVAKLVVTDNKEDVYSDISGSYNVKAIDSEGKEVQNVTIVDKNVNVDIKVNHSKSVSINVKTKGTLPNEAKLNSIAPSQTTVQIVAPKSILDTINEVETEPIDLALIAESKDIPLSITVPDGVTIMQGQDNLSAKVDMSNFITKSFDVKYSDIALEKDLDISKLKDTSSVSIKGYEDKMKNVTLDNISMVLDLSEFNKEGTFEQMPRVTLQNLDSTFSVTSVDKIKFTLKKQIQTSGQVSNETNEESSNQDKTDSQTSKNKQN